MNESLQNNACPSSPHGTTTRSNRPSTSQVHGAGADRALPGNRVSSGTGVEKPRAYLAGKYWDCGYEYERWVCAGRYRVGRGPTPEAAYDEWARLTNVDKREGI